jgi:hypothetical protein
VRVNFKALSTVSGVHEVGGQNVIETDALEDFHGEVDWDGKPPLGSDGGWV